MFKELVHKELPRMDHASMFFFCFFFLKIQLLWTNCSCNPGWDGDLCDICAPGYYGPTCTKCNCPTNSFCDDGITQSGNCICFSGWQGKGCSQETIETNQVLSSGGIGLSVGFVVGFLVK